MTADVLISSTFARPSRGGRSGAATAVSDVHSGRTERYLDATSAAHPATRMRLSPLIVALASIMLVACRNDTQPQIEIPLTDLRVGMVDGRQVSLPVRGAAKSVRLVLESPGTLDVFLRLPAHSRLVVGLARHVSAAAFSVSVEGENGRETLTLEKASGGEWSASLGRFDRTVVRLRLQNRSTEALEWIRPRVVGNAGTAPPVLDPGIRPRTQPINVLFYLIDTLRADRLSAYGYHRPTSPNLEQLAKRSLLFSNAYAPASHTIPSIASLFWSRLPSGIIRHKNRLGGPTMAESFQAAGYRTAAFQANLLLQSQLYARGFDEYRVVRRSTGNRKRPVDAADLHRPVLAWLRAHRDRPFFLFVQSMDVHFPYLPPPPYREMFVRTQGEHGAGPSGDAGTDVDERLRAFLEPMSQDRYDGCIAYADHELANLLTALRDLGLHERTAVVITADHGEPLGQHGELLHGRSLYEEIVRVPLVMFLPWHAGGERIAPIVSLMDLGPTVLDLAGIPVPHGFLGRSLLQPQEAMYPQSAFGEQLNVRTQETLESYVREGPWKLILGVDGARLYHLPSDPEEERDVSADHPIESGHLTTALMSRVPAYRDDAPPPPSLGSDLPAEQRKELEDALKALGYVE